MDDLYQSEMQQKSDGFQGFPDGFDFKSLTDMIMEKDHDSASAIPTMYGYNFGFYDTNQQKQN